MENKLPLKERSIRQIYIDGEAGITYEIPIYQRNYAWELEQIQALVKDVFDAMHKDRNSPYYIGTLVTYRRGDNKFEVIDGQQRLTTIYLILKALKVDGIKNGLTYTAREASRSTLANLDRYPDLGDNVDKGLRDGYGFVKKSIKDIVGNTEKGDFIQYFLDKVHIIHYEVPKDVDLNHYFEVMNSRGEQLEQHEIVKSVVGQCLSENKEELSLFSRIWEACSEMNLYIQQVFEDSSIFGSNFSTLSVTSFDGIPRGNTMDGKSSIAELINAPIGKIDKTRTTDKTYIPVSTHNEAMLSGAWTSIAQ